MYMSPHHTLFSIALFIITTTAANLPQNPNPLIQPAPSNPNPLTPTTNLSATLTEKIECKVWGQGPERPLYTDCAAAINELPIYPTHQATFHDRGPDDYFRLPVVRTHGTCKLSVEMWGTRTEQATWPAIKEAAVDMSKKCRKSGAIFLGKRAKTGGRTYSGAQGYVNIYLWRVRGSLGVGNASVGIGDVEDLVEDARASA